jgi:hypothetical protein
VVNEVNIIYILYYMGRKGSRKCSRKVYRKSKGKRKRTKSRRAHGKPSSPELSGGDGQVILQILVTGVKSKYCLGVITGVGALTGFTDPQAKEDYTDSLEDYEIFVGGMTRINRVTKRVVQVGDTIKITVEFDQGDATMDSL